MLGTGIDHAMESCMMWLYLRACWVWNWDYCCGDYWLWSRAWESMAYRPSGLLSVFANIVLLDTATLLWSLLACSCLYITISAKGRCERNYSFFIKPSSSLLTPGTNHRHPWEKSKWGIPGCSGPCFFLANPVSVHGTKGSWGMAVVGGLGDSVLLPESGQMHRWKKKWWETC